MGSEIIELKDLDILTENNGETKEKSDVIDYKMVTFSLGGKDYGIDIMKVKEISKASKFTYVPNSIPFVKGVYNLRGDIISVIDLRLMFNVPIPESNGQPENMIILRLEENTLGIIVDTIDKVVGIAAEKIQPPHPLFGDINIKFIKGIVENNEKLYIILDVESIFNQKSAESALQKNHPSGDRRQVTSKIDSSLESPSKDNKNVDYNFVVETLATFNNFIVSPVNEQWVRTRFDSWCKHRTENNQSIQLKNAIDANEFLNDFESPYSGYFWDADYADPFSELLEDNGSGLYSVWNVGCGKGEESYSIAACLRKRFSDKNLKIYANDADLLNISTAPNLIFAKNLIPAIYDDFITEGRNGWQFKSEIKELILFEYHDVTNDNQVPPTDLIVARDILSYLSESDQQKLIDIFYEKLKPGGILITGANEIIAGNGWEALSKSRIPAYKKS